MTLKIPVSLDVYAIFPSPFCLEGKVFLEPQYKSEPQNHGQVDDKTQKVKCTHTKEGIRHT